MAAGNDIASVDEAATVGNGQADEELSSRFGRVRGAAVSAWKQLDLLVAVPGLVVLVAFGSEVLSGLVVGWSWFEVAWAWLTSYSNRELVGYTNLFFLVARVGFGAAKSAWQRLESSTSDWWESRRSGRGSALVAILLHRGPGLPMTLALLVGCSFVVFLWAVLEAACPAGENVFVMHKVLCEHGTQRFFFLAPALIAAPNVLLSWYWRTVHRRKELAKYDERFAKAVELLGSEKRATRQGGLYALEHLLRESKAHRRQIVETLCAFVRDWENNAQPREAIVADRPAMLGVDKVEVDIEGEVDEMDEETSAASTRRMRKLPTDVRAAIVVAIRDPWRKENGGSEGLGSVLVDFAGVDFSWCSLTRIDLRGANLEGANLERANLEFAWLEGATLRDARLVNAELEGAKLQSARLDGADLTGANLERARLENASAYGAIFDGTDLRSASLEGAILEGASFKKPKSEIDGAESKPAKLEDAQLRGAKLSGAVFSGCVVDAANMEQADLTSAMFEGVRFDSVVLSDVQFKNATFRDVDFESSSGLTQDQVDAARFDGSVKLPAGLYRKRN